MSKKVVVPKQTLDHRIAVIAKKVVDDNNVLLSLESGVFSKQIVSGNAKLVDYGERLDVLEKRVDVDVCVRASLQELNASRIERLEKQVAEMRHRGWFSRFFSFFRR